MVIKVKRETNKKQKKKSFGSSLFSMILIMNLCSIVVLSVFNYYVFHRLSGKALLESFLDYNERVTEIAFNNIDNQIMHSVLKISQLHFSEIRGNKPLLIAQEEELASFPEKVQSLATEMKKIQKTYPYITNIDLYYEGTNTVVTGFDKVHFPSDELQVNRYLPWLEDYRSGALPEGFCYIADGVYLREEPVISYVKRISMPKWEGKDIVIAISVSPQSFTEYLDQQEGDLTILTREQQLLYDTSGPEAGRRKLDAIGMLVQRGEQEDKEGEGGSGYIELHTDQQKMTVFHSKSQNTGLTYLYSVDAARFYENYNLTSRMLLINFLISIAFNIIVLLMISYYNYFTYRKKVVTMTENAGISMGHADRSFEGSLNRLTSRITDLHEAVQSTKGMVFQSAVRSAILNRKTGEGTGELGAYLNGDSVCAFIIGLSETELERLNIERLQEEYLPGQGSYDVLFTTIEKDSLVALTIFDSRDGDRVGMDFRQRMNLHWGNCVGVSGKIFPLEEEGIQKSYQSAVEADRYRYIITQEPMLSYDKIQIGSRKASGSHLKLFDAIKKDIQLEDLLGAKLHLEMLMESFKSGSYTIEYCMSTLRDLVTLFYQIMQQYQLDTWIVFGYDIREYYKKVPNIDVFYGWCGSLCEMILKNIHQKKMSVDTDIRTRILSLIEENPEKDISLDFLAEQLAMRPDAASRIFRQMMGTGYTEYMKTRKLNRALELLEQDCSVMEIADRLGYSTSQYFIKVFKENFGETPHQYKKNRK